MWVTTLLFHEIVRQKFKLLIYTQQNCSPKLGLFMCSHSQWRQHRLNPLKLLVYMGQDTVSETAPASSLSEFSCASFLQRKFYSRELFFPFYFHSPSESLFLEPFFFFFKHFKWFQALKKKRLFTIIRKVRKRIKNKIISGSRESFTQQAFLSSDSSATSGKK